MATTKKRMFSTAPVTAPTAGEPVAAGASTAVLPDVGGPGRPAFLQPSSPDVVPPRAQDAETPGGRDAEAPERPEVTASSGQDVPTPRAPEAEAAKPHAVVTPVRHETETPAGQEASTPRRRDVKTEERIAFTWRLTTEEAERLDMLALEMRRKIGRGSLARTKLLQAMVDLTSERQDVKEDLAKRLLDG